MINKSNKLRNLNLDNKKKEITQAKKQQENPIKRDHNHNRT